MIARGVRAFSQEGDGVLILSPVYHPFRRVIEEAGRKTVVSSLLEEDGVYTIDFPDLDKKAAEAKILLFAARIIRWAVSGMWKNSKKWRKLPKNIICSLSPTKSITI